MRVKLGPTREHRHRSVIRNSVGGAGFEFPMGPGRLLIEGRYIYGLTNLNDSSAGDDSSSKNRTWAIFAGFAVPIGR